MNRQLHFTTLLVPLLAPLLLAVPATAQVIGEPFPPWTPGTLDIHQISTGRGNCAFFVLPDGTTMVVDAGELMDQHFDTFQQVYDERFQPKYGYWRPVVERSVAAFLKCGDLQEGFARVRCPKCKHEMFVAYSCKQRCTCATRSTGYPATRNAPC